MRHSALVTYRHSCPDCGGRVNDGYAAPEIRCVCTKSVWLFIQKGENGLVFPSGPFATVEIAEQWALAAPRHWAVKVVDLSLPSAIA